MTSRNNEVRIDIEVEGGARAEKQFNRAEKGARGLGRSTRGLINPLIGAGLVSGILGAGLIGLALSSGSASNSLFRIQGAVEGLVSTFTRKLEPAIDKAASVFEKLPIAAQLGVLAASVILGVVFVKLIGIAAGAIAAAVTALVAKAIAIPLVVGITKAVVAAGLAIKAAIGPLLAGLFSASALAVAGVVVSLASLALIAWDLIFNNGDLLKRFENWLSGIGWIRAIETWDKEVLTPYFTKAWNNAVDLFRKYFIAPFFTAWYATRDFFKGTFVNFFTQAIPNFFKAGWEKVVEWFWKFFANPIIAAWNFVEGFFRGAFPRFFTETIPRWARMGWEKVVEWFWKFFANPIIAAWNFVEGFFRGAFPRFFTETIPRWARMGWEKVVSFFNSYFKQPLLIAWIGLKKVFAGDFISFFTETIPRWARMGWEKVVSFFNSYFKQPLLIAWIGLKKVFAGDFISFFTETIPSFFSRAWEGVVKLFRGFANTIIGILNGLIRAIGRVPIPSVKVGVGYVGIGPAQIPYPTISVSSRPLSSLANIPQIPTISAPLSLTPSRPGYLEGQAGSLSQRPDSFITGGGGTRGTTNNYYSLTATDFAREVERLINAPGAQARAVGAP